MRDNKSALESAILFINNYEFYDYEEIYETAKRHYNTVSNDKRIGIEKKQKILQDIRVILRRIK